MAQRIKRICVYSGSADGVNSVYYDSAYQLGQLLAKKGISLVFGAGKTGLMGAVAEGCLSEKGFVIGVVPKILNEPQLIHANLTRLEIVENMHLRKARMSELADGFIALPGGFGTFEELFETLTWTQIGIHHKPIGLFNINNYFHPLLQMVDHALREKFIYAEHQILLLEDSDPGALLEKLISFQHPAGLNRWITRENE